MVSTPTLEALNETFPADWPHIEYLILDAYFGTGNDSSPGVSDSKQYVGCSTACCNTTNIDKSYLDGQTAKPSLRLESMRMPVRRMSRWNYL